MGLHPGGCPPGFLHAQGVTLDADANTSLTCPRHHGGRSPRVTVGDANTLWHFGHFIEPHAPRGIASTYLLLMYPLGATYRPRASSGDIVSEVPPPVVPSP